MADPAFAPPAGFAPLTTGGGFIERNGPIYAARESDGGAVFGFRVEAHHCNLVGICHGGWLASFCDMVLPLTARLDGLEDRFLLTIHLDLDFLAPVPLGAWVEARGRVLRRGGRTIFVDATASVAGEAVVRASGVFKVGPPAPALTIAMPDMVHAPVGRTLAADD